MANIGEQAALEVVRESSIGLFLNAGPLLGEVLLPLREMPERWSFSEPIPVFLYNDSEDRPIATCKVPKVLPGQFAFLEVVSRTPVGAFLDWGLPKDLLLPFSEQRDEIAVGKSGLIYLDLDLKTDRLVATQRVRRFLDLETPKFKIGDSVEVLIHGKTGMGYKAIVENRHSGLIFGNQVFRRIGHGERLTAFITRVRPDGKLDLSLEPPGRAAIDNLETRVETALRAAGGFLALNDETSPEEISEAFGVSKKAFKRATGALFRKRRIVFEDDGIRLFGNK